MGAGQYLFSRCWPVIIQDSGSLRENSLATLERICVDMLDQISEDPRPLQLHQLQLN